MKAYTYKNIEVFEYWGTWQANYNDNGKRFALHRKCCKTKKQAIELAKAEVNYLNERR